VNFGCLINREENDQWLEEAVLEGHTDWVRDVAWSPAAGLTRMKIASCSQDRRVIVWNNKETDGISFTPEVLHVFNDALWHVSWNFVGDVLAVSGGDNHVSVAACCPNWEAFVSSLSVILLF